MKKIMKILKGLSDENRLRIICLIFNKNGLCVCEIQEIIGLSQPTISFNLKKLEEAEIITHSKNGLWVNYSINENLEPNLRNIISLLIDELKDDKKIKEILNFPLRALDGVGLLLPLVPLSKSWTTKGPAGG